MTAMLRFLPMPIRNRFASREDAQALIFFALVSGVLALTMGLAVEGGRVFVEYRRLQAAADMAALVGAQDLPCGLTDTTCMRNAQTLACQTAASNGFSTCGDRSSPGAFVPPVTCSPYDPIDYGNDSGDPSPYGNPSCKSTTAGLSFYDYIEVQLSDNLGTVPIFGTPVTLSAHAVARHGVPTPKDYAVSQLDPNGALSVGGSFTFFANGAIFANGALQPGGTSTTCEGGYFTHSGSTDPGTESTYAGGVAGFAPPKCYLSDGVTPQTVSVPNWDNNLPAITDPYCSSVSPPYSGHQGTDCNGVASGPTTLQNCLDCTKLGWYYNITTSTWSQGDIQDNGTGGNVYEMFPGVYGSLKLGIHDQVYVNPGVYTFTGTVSFDKGNLCVFGAPACNSGTATGDCGDPALSWTPGTSQGTNATGNQWYYKCSPYGYWDQWLKRPGSSTGGPATVSCGDGVVPAYGPSCKPPMWWDDSTNAPSTTVPLNGVTWQFTSTSAGAIGGNGSGSGALAYYLAAPNPCPGTGSGWTPSSDGMTGAVPFNVGDSAAYYTYSSQSTDNLIAARNAADPTTYPSSTLQSPIIPGWGSQIYPSMDLTVAGECKPDTLEVWPGEMGGTGQHLHFALFDRQNNLGILNGNQGQSFTGIMYFPAAGSTLDVRGAGSSGGGVPFILGQLIGWDINFGGNGTVDLIYRPCNVKQSVCASGLGTQLIQ